jgi:hypothetical protein
MCIAKVRRAWLITSVSHKKNQEKVVSVLKYQKSLRQIEECITQLYIDTLYPSERITYLRNKNNEGLPCVPIYNKNGYSIGHEPHLHARQVRNLRADNENLTWEEL